ncbi:universal stress protein [Mesorhizobium sp.]|uniref:universal stress protein n=1 Tax=Mesorhizobium sp. TaxID=1871066 RepID=UPI00120AC23F|nr:universal stress protein [Mesorhizobium sp.]TIP09233.1 MAG: universal stress protein UspA [Mesorhizobium sp.]
MLRSILVALDGSASSVEAGQLALELGKRHRAHVEGLGIVNSAWIQRPEPVPIGGMAYKKALDLTLLKTASDRVNAVLRTFGERAKDADFAAFETKRVDGDPRIQIEFEATAHDLVVLGRNSLFDVDGELYEMPLCIDRVIRREPRPVLLVPPGGKPDEDLAAPVLIAFDGSPAASRTLHMFALLGLPVEREVHVLTVDNRSEDAAAASAGRACALLKRHGTKNAHGIGLGDLQAGTPAEAILGTAKALGAGMIAMGAYGHRGIREIFGSCTRHVLENSSKSLFLYH